MVAPEIFLKISFFYYKLAVHFVRVFEVYVIKCDFNEYFSRNVITAMYILSESFREQSTSKTLAKEALSWNIV